MSSYFVHKDGDRYGPLTLEQLQEYVDAGVLGMEDMAALEGAEDWVSLGDLLEKPAILPESLQLDHEPEPDQAEAGLDAEQELSPARKKAAMAVLVVGLLGGGSALGWYLWPKSSEPAPPEGQPPVEEQAQKPPPKPPAPQAFLPPEVPSTLELVDAAVTDKVLADARGGNALARLYVGIRRFEGWGLPMNRALAFEAVSQSARAVNGPVVAKVYLSQLLFRGRPTPQQIAEARQLMRPDLIGSVHAQARKGNPLAQYVYGLHHHPRRGFRGNPAEAMTWFRRSAEQGFAPAQYQMGLRAELMKKPDEAARWFAAAARQRHGMALQRTGLQYLTGRSGVAKNAEEGLRLTVESGQLGNVAARRGLAFMYETGSAGVTNTVEACAWYLVLAPSEITAQNKVKQLYETLPAPEYMKAVTRARVIEPTVRIPLFAPAPPFIGKPVETQLGGTPETPAERIQDTLRKIGSGDVMAIWQALPRSYQAEVNALAKQGGARLDPELHKAIFSLMTKVEGVLKEKEEPLQSALVEFTELPEDQLAAGWGTAVQLLNLLGESKLADADWVKDPDVEVFLKETGGKIFGEIEKFGNAEGAGHLAVLKSVTCTGEETGDGLQITIDLGTGDPKETVLFQEVEGKWLPKDWVDQWPVWMAAARAVVAEPEVAPGVPDRQKILASQLQGLEGALDQLSDRELAGQLGQVLKGMLEDDALPEPEEEPAAP